MSFFSISRGKVLSGRGCEGRTVAQLGGGGVKARASDGPVVPPCAATPNAQRQREILKQGNG